MHVIHEFKDGFRYVFDFIPITYSQILENFRISFVLCGLICVYPKNEETPAAVDGGSIVWRTGVSDAFPLRT